ncbi:homeodomain-interacting protein kinase 4-like [Sander lucioperca]|uniref:homeodomain-interacting protein kinase 4-like n=1 Tax=Sander lucioperca TaxID=283035 RepID=UPI00165393F6|nr:homeodomain-interacting protein kinase 4-like [Sander lucioperca]
MMLFFLQLQYIIDLLGPPPAPTVNVEWKWERFFKKTASNQWILKTPQEYWRTTTTDNRHYTFRSLDEMKTTCLEKDNATEDDERWECIELLKAMLKWTEKERITPSGILNHPFITMSYLNSCSHLSSCNRSVEAETSPSQASGPSASPAAKPGIDKAIDSNTKKAAEPGTRRLN